VKRIGKTVVDNARVRPVCPSQRRRWLRGVAPAAAAVYKASAAAEERRTRPPDAQRMIFVADAYSQFPLTDFTERILHYLFKHWLWKF